MQNNTFVSILAGALAGLVVSLIVVRTYVPNAQQPVGSEPLPESAQESDHERSVIEAVRAASPAVVSIVITQDVPILEQYFEEIPGPFNDFFGSSPFSVRIPRLRERGTQPQEVGGGSGFLISPDGMIVTNRHVVSREDASYTVFLADGSKHEATVIARDPVNDIAIMNIDITNAPYLEFGNSDELEVGQTTIAIGNALSEFQNTVSTGVVSGLARSIEAGDGFGEREQLEHVIQTDAAINPGNSGGPLLDLAGNVVGVNVAVALGSENIGFAIPSNEVQAIVESVRETGKISRPYLGVRYTEITAALKEANNLSVDHGVLVIRGESPEDLAVIPGSPADKAGIVEGDIILEIDGVQLNEDSSLASIIRAKQVGQTISLKLQSKGQEKTVQVTLEDFPQE